jgi:uncharacterized damage-inducible protein DinB
MNYYGPKDLAESFRTVRKNTIVVAEEIPEDKYSFRAAPDTRTVAQTLYHVAAAPRVQQQIHGVERRSTLEGFDFPGLIRRLIAEEQTPRTKAQLVALLREDGERWAAWIEQLSDDFLGERVQYPAGMSPASKTRFEMLTGVKEHEMHHRAQLMLIERMVGIVPHLTRQMQERMAAITKATATS